MNIFSKNPPDIKKKEKHYKNFWYLRKLIHSSWMERLWPTWRRHVLEEEVKPIGIHSIDNWRIKWHMDNVMNYIHMALDDTNIGRNLISEKNEAETLENKKWSLQSEIEVLESDYKRKVDLYVKKEQSLENALNIRTKEIAEQHGGLDIQLEMMVEKVREKAKQINAKNTKKEIDLVCVPWIKLTYSWRLWVCGDNWKFNGKILREDDHKFILIEVNGTLLWHIKIRWEDTFLSYVNAVDENWKMILKKWGIYTIQWKNTVMKEVKVEDNGKSYICAMPWANFNYMRMSRIRRRDELIDAHVEKIINRDSERINVEI